MSTGRTTDAVLDCLIRVELVVTWFGRVGAPGGGDLALTAIE
jgi:hypothetical protein